MWRFFGVRGVEWAAVASLSPDHVLRSDVVFAVRGTGPTWRGADRRGTVSMSVGQVREAGHSFPKVGLHLTSGLVQIRQGYQ